MAQDTCPYLNGEVELTDEREHHIAERHPDLLPDYRHLIAETLSRPDCRPSESARFYLFGSCKGIVITSNRAVRSRSMTTR